MVCFELEIICQIPKNGNQAAIERRVEYILRHCNAESQRKESSNTTISYVIRVCDDGAVGILRDLPTPFNVTYINILSGGNLYTYRNHREPPRIRVLKDIYWLAKSTERWKIMNE